MIDVTVVATAAITGGVGLGAALLQARTSRQAVEAERARQHEVDVAQRRRERQEAYQCALDLLTALNWDMHFGPADYDVVTQFNKPFLAAANSLRTYGSPRSVAALDAIQAAIALLNQAADDADRDAAWVEIGRAAGQLVDAARVDVGPRAEDGLEQVPFQSGIGPFA